MIPDTLFDIFTGAAAHLKIPLADASCSASRHIAVSVFQGQVEKIDQAEARRLVVRVVEEQRTGFSFTEDLFPESVARALARARENARWLPARPVELPLPRPGLNGAQEALGLYAPDLESLPVADLINFGLRLERECLSGDSRLINVPHLQVFRVAGEARHLSTRGVEYRSRANSAGAYAGVVAAEGGQPKMGFSQYHRRRFDPEAWREIGAEARARALAKLGARPVSPGNFPVVFDRETAPEFIGLFLTAFSGEAALKGMSRLRGRLGEKIAAEGVCLEDRPFLPGAGGSAAFDGEGYPAQPLTLIENGVFRNFLYHDAAGREAGAASTGHGGMGAQGGIYTHHHNLVLEPGRGGLEDLLRLPPACLLVTEMQGTAGCNAVSGDFSLGVQGFWVERGERVHPVDQVTVAGNFFDLLQNIKTISADVDSNLGSLRIPAFLAGPVAVSG